MLRLCIVHVDEFFVLKKNVCYDKVNNIKPVLGGEVGSDMNFALEVFWFKGLNYTATKVASAQRVCLFDCSKPVRLHAKSC